MVKDQSLGELLNIHEADLRALRIDLDQMGDTLAELKPPHTLCACKECFPGRPGVVVEVWRDGFDTFIGGASIEHDGRLKPWPEGSRIFGLQPGESAQFRLTRIEP